MSIIGEPGNRDELHGLQSNEIYLPRKDTREAVKTLGHGALACPSCDVPIVMAEAVPITAVMRCPFRQKYAETSARLADRDQGVWGALLFGTRFGGTKIFQNGGEVVSPADDRKAAFAQPAGLEALQWTHDRLWKDRAWAQPGVVREAGFRDRFAMLAGAKLAMTEEMASWAIGDVVKGNPDQVQDWDIAPLPRGKQRTSRASIDAWTIWKGAPEQDASWEFLKFLQTGDWLDIQTQKAGYQPPRVSLQDHYLDVLKRAIPQVATKNLGALTHPVKNKYARPDAIFRKDGEAWRVFGEAWDASMARNDQGVTPAFTDAARRVDAAMV